MCDIQIFCVFKEKNIPVDQIVTPKVFEGRLFLDKYFWIVHALKHVGAMLRVLDNDQEWET